MQFNVASALGSLALTASIYGAGPLLLRLRKGPISSKALKWLHIGYTAVLAFAFSIYDFLMGTTSVFPLRFFGAAFSIGGIEAILKRATIRRFNPPPPCRQLRLHLIPSCQGRSCLPSSPKRRSKRLRRGR